MGHVDAQRRIDLHLPEVEKTLNEPEKQRAGITGTVDSVLAPFFSETSFTDAFSGSEEFDLGLLDKGHVIVLNVDKNQFPGASVLAFLLGFEQISQHMRRRIARRDDRENINSILFVCDEYAQLADKRSHPQMWRVARESRVCPLVAYQIHSDLQSVIGPSTQAADGMIANFNTRIIFPATDSPTVALVSAGKAEVLRTSTSETSGTNNGSNNGVSGGQGGFSSGESSGESYGRSSSTQWVDRDVVDLQLMDSLLNKVIEEIPVEDQVAEVVIRTIQGSRRVIDVCRIRAWDPPR